MSLKFPHRMSPRKLKGTFGPGSGPAERIKRLRMCVTGLLRHERIESTHARCDETRGYAEKLLQIAVKNGDTNKYAMEMADYWLLEKDLVHKLFKVLVPRYQHSMSAYTQMYMLPPDVPGFGMDRAVLELKGNPWPPVVPKKRETKYFLTNILINELKKDHQKTHKSPIVNKLLKESSVDNVINSVDNVIDSVEKQYVQDNLKTEDYIVGSAKETMPEEKKTE